MFNTNAGIFTQMPSSCGEVGGGGQRGCLIFNTNAAIFTQMPSSCGEVGGGGQRGCPAGAVGWARQNEIRS